MTDLIDMIREPILRELIQVTPHVGAVISGEGNGFAVIVRLGDAEKNACHFAWKDSFIRFS